MFDESGKFMGFDQPNYTGLPNEIFDHWQGLLPGPAFNVLVYIGRWTCGFHRLEASISKEEMLSGHFTRNGKRLDNGAGVSRRALYGPDNMLTFLETLNCIKKVEHFGPGKKAKATRYRLKVIAQSPLARVFDFDIPTVCEPQEPQYVALHKSAELDLALNKCAELSPSQKCRAYIKKTNKEKPPEPPPVPPQTSVEPECSDVLSGGGGDVFFRIKTHLIEDCLIDPEGAFPHPFKEEQARKVEEDIDLGTFQNFHRKGSVVKYLQTRLERHLEPYLVDHDPEKREARATAKWISVGYRREGNLKDAVRFASSVLEADEEKVLSVIPQAITYTEQLESSGRIKAGTAERMRKEAA